MVATIRKPLTVGGKIQMCVTATGAFEDLTVANWATYVITMTETPASSYGYVGTWPAGLTTVGWYIVDVYDGATIAGTLAGTLLGYWDGTNYVLGGADAREISGDATAADNCELMFDGTGYAGGTIVFQSDLTKIHGTAITETATQLAGAFTKFFDVATPTGTVNSIPDAVAGAAGGLMISGSNAGTTTFGALTVTGATTLTGAVSLGSTLGITGAVTLSSTLATGAVTLNGLAITNALSVGTTTTLTGAVSLGSTLGVTGAATLASLAITGALSVGTTTTLTGAVSLGSTLGVTGAATLASLAITGALSVGTTTTLTGAVSLASTLAVAGTTTLTGAVALGSTLAVAGTTTLTGAVSMPAGLAANLTGNITGNMTGNITGTLSTVTTLTNLPAVTTDWLSAAGVSAAAVTKIQSGLATPTNITAGTITTVTNLTNAPTGMALEATLAAIKGGTWSDETLVTIQAAVDAIGISAADMLAQAKAALVYYNLDHLCLTAVADNDDMAEVADGTILSNLLTKTGDTSDYVPSTDSLEAVGAAMGWTTTINQWSASATAGSGVIEVVFEHNGVRADPYSVELASSDGSYGILRTDTSVAVADAGTSMTKVSTGVYRYTITEPASDLNYLYSVDAVAIEGGASKYITGGLAGTASEAAVGYSVNTMADHLRGLIDVNPDAAGGTVPDRIKREVRELGIRLWEMRDWRFRRQPGTLTIAADATTGTMPDGFGELDHRIMRGGDDKEYALLWTEDPTVWQEAKDLLFADDDNTGTPSLATFYWSSGAWTAKVCPAADKEYVFDFWHVTRNPWKWATVVGDDEILSGDYWPESFDEGWRLLCEATMLRHYRKDDSWKEAQKQFNDWLANQTEERDETMTDETGIIRDEMDDFPKTTSAVLGRFPGLPGWPTKWYGST